MTSLKRNDLLVLKSIFFNNDTTRQSLINETQLSPSSVSSILTTLENSKYITKIGKTKPISGRPSSLYRIRPDLGLSLGISIKPDNIRIVSTNYSKEIVLEKQYKLKLSSDLNNHVRDITAQIAQRTAELLSDSFFAAKSIVTIGIALPGMVDTMKNVWLQGLHMTGVNHIKLVEELQKSFAVPVIIEDEARALAYREKIVGLGHGIENLVLLYIDQGMGTGIIMNNQLYQGFHGLSGEIGHIKHPRSKYRCSCNNVGCMETILSNKGILKVFKERIREGVRSTLQEYDVAKREELTLESILSAARHNDRLARTALYEIGEFVGDAIVILIKLFNPQRIVVSGSISIFKDFLLESMQSIVNHEVHSEMLQDLDICFAEYSQYNEAHGAALLGLARHLDQL